MSTPLEDPAYRPEHPPVDGAVPAVVEKWGPRSQLRWFDRFSRELKRLPSREWDRFYCSSTEHRGLCCQSCAEDREYGYGLDWCCCRATPDPASSG